MFEDDLWKHEELHERADRPDRSIVKEKVGIDKEPFNFLKCKTKSKDKIVDLRAMSQASLVLTYPSISWASSSLRASICDIWSDSIEKNKKQ